MECKGCRGKSRTYRFWELPESWAYVHYVLPLSVYATTGGFWPAVALVYGFESVEYLIGAGPFPYFQEPTPGDSLLGDPAMGILAVSGFFWLDYGIGWTASPAWGPPLWARILCLVAQALAALLVRLDEPGGFPTSALRPGVLLYGILGYQAPLYATYAPYWSDAPESQLAVTGTLAWSLAVVLQTLVCAPRGNPLRCSVFTRAFTTGLVLLIAALITFLVVTPST